MDMMNPSVMVSRLDLVFLELATGELIFVDSPRVSGILRCLYSKDAVREVTEVGITHLGTPGPPGAPWWVVPPSRLPPGTSLAHPGCCGP